MTPTNEQIAEQVNTIGKHLADIGEHLNEVAFSDAKLYELIANRMPGVTPDEHAALTSAVQACLKNGNLRQAICKKFRQEVENFSRL
jgi:formiminotetrahydrofolate cyclodeaminase